MADSLAAITSANELLVVDRQNLSSAQTSFFDGALDGSNCLVAGDPHGQTLLCSSIYGTVATFDVRTQRKVSYFNLDRAVTALASCGSTVAVGTELKSQQAIVSLWDVRQNKQIWQNAENNDEITAMSFHPSRQNILLAGGDDGLVSLFDSNIAEEDESLLQVINHGPIHRAGFIGDHRIFALSSDQNFAVHPVSTPGDEQDPEPTLIGDVRPLIPCQYVIDVLKSGEDYVIAAGTNTESSRVDIVKLENAQDIGAQPRLDAVSKHSIEPAHGEEVVRALFIDDKAGVIFTAGEDSHIRASRASNQTADASSKTTKTSKHKKGFETRYKPY